jgi:starch synthase
MHILIVAAENSALHGAKVGGLADVVGEAGPELEKQGGRVTTIMPSYGFVHHQNPSTYAASCSFYFRGFDHRVDIFEAESRHQNDRVRHLVVDHPAFSDPSGMGSSRHLYFHDPSDRPFATDAGRFALFCTAVASALVQQVLPRPECLHLHDWHMAFILMLRKFHPYFHSLKDIRTVFTIHNLAMQGIRPFKGHESSLEAWFPGLWFEWLDLHDPGTPDCVNPMAAGIRLADMVHTVSPSYAEEILQPSRKPDVYAGGEGLESVLWYAASENRLIGILNGCVYPEDRRPPKLDFQTLCKTLKSGMSGWLAGKEAVPVAHFLSENRLSDPAYHRGEPSVLATSVSRLTDQKMLLMKASGTSGRPALEEILRLLQRMNGIYILLGTGDWAYERFLSDMSAGFENFIFLNGFSETCAEALYANGDLFLMPSSFEPCGLSQMLAMRDAQPCVAHHVGGLKDTIRHNENGFTFTGDSLVQQVDSFVSTVATALTMHKEAPDQWRKICRQAEAQRFSWQNSTAQYMEILYRRQ